jgi:hypothetical protein
MTKIDNPEASSSPPFSHDREESWLVTALRRESNCR